MWGMAVSGFYYEPPFPAATLVEKGFSEPPLN